jgi:hypothetical protein
MYLSGLQVTVESWQIVHSQMSEQRCGKTDICHFFLEGFKDLWLDGATLIF